nr:sirohydrochlorin ferrochelatase, chloroplastic-like isoform X1 [Ipomoea batatas]
MESLSLSSQFSIRSLSISQIGRTHGGAVPDFVKVRKFPSKTGYLAPRLCLAIANAGFRGERNCIKAGDGVIIVDHGSRRKESNLMLNEFVAMFQEKTKYPIVEPAHMGARRIIVSPFFLFPGRHWQQDIPSLTAEAAKLHPGIPFIITAPLGAHELLVRRSILGSVTTLKSPEPQSPIPVSYPDVTTSPHKWSMISASPIGQPSGYDPNRIPLSVFGSRSSAPMEWSVASTESLFSIHVGNNSFSRDRAMSLSRSEDGSCEDKRCNNGRKSFSSTLAPVIEGALDSEEKSELASEALQVQESNDGSPQQSSEEISKIAASKEVHSFAMKSNTSDGRETSPASNPHHLSDDSGTSSSSFAFPVLVNDSVHGSSLKSVPEKPESEQKSQPEEDSESQAEGESSKEEEEVSAYGIVGQRWVAPESNVERQNWKSPNEEIVEGRWSAYESNANTMPNQKGKELQSDFPLAVVDPTV